MYPDEDRAERVSAGKDLELFKLEISRTAYFGSLWTHAKSSLVVSKDRQ